jgi:Tfp pilus assembly protein PilF
MPKIAADDPAATDGMVADHAFLGANTALPRQLGIDEWVDRNQAFLRDILTVDVGAIEIGEGQRFLAPPPTVTLPAGAPITVDVVVRNVGSGHFYPAGIADLREAWLEVTLVEGDGDVALASGWLDAGGHLDPEAHRWQAVLLDGEGMPVIVHDVERAQVVLTSRRIMLGASDVVRVAFPAPAAASRLEVRVLDRKFPRDYVEFAVGADAAAMPITVVASTSIDLTPGPAKVDPSAAPDPARLRNLGIGHLLRGDTALAREASEAAAARMPDDPGPRLDLARAALDDGELESAEAHVAAADAIAPGHPTAAWLLARIRAGQGDHPAAIAALDVALAKFPRDRELLVMKADSLYRLERDTDAATLLQIVLEIDPEHLAAHALLTRIRREQGDEVAAAHHQRLWDRVRPHSDDEVVTETARRADPALDRRANLQYVLPLRPPLPEWRRAL